MRYVEVSGEKISVVGLGTWQFGSREWGYGAEYAGKTAIELVHRALELGVNLVDSAEFYGFGKSESIIGSSIAGMRERVYLATKLFPVLPLAPQVVSHARASARRLGVDQIDLYQIHWPNPIVPIAETAKGLLALVNDGSVGNVGVSNFSLRQWMRAEEALGRVVMSNQVHYSLLTRSPELELVPFAQAHDRLIIAYSPLEQGVLGGGYSSEHRPRGLRSFRKLFLPANLNRAQPLLAHLARIARNHHATSAQISLAWLISKANVAVIPGASTVSQLESNVAAADIELDEDEIEDLSELSSQFEPVGPRSCMADAAALLKRR